MVLSHQLTEDGAGRPKPKNAVNGTMTVINAEANGKVSAEFDGEYYTYDFTARKASNDLVLSMTNPAGQRDAKAPYDLHQTDFRDLRKKKVGTLIENLLFPADNAL